MVRKVKGGWRIYSESKHMMLPKVYPSEEAAQEQVDRMEMFKHIPIKKRKNI
jgi:hypothetical protein